MSNNNGNEAQNNSTLTPATKNGRNVAQRIGTSRMEVLLRPLMPDLYSLTVDPEKLADHLAAVRVMTKIQVDECNSKATPYYKNKFIYDIIWKKNPVTLFIVALEKTENDHLFPIIETFLSTGQTPPSQ